MSYPSTLLNVNHGSLLLKPKPRYTSALDDETNSIGSPSPPRYSFISESHPYANYRGYGVSGNSIRNSRNLPDYFFPPYSRLDNFPYISGMEGDPTRLSSSVIPCNFECGPAHLPALGNPVPAVVNGRFHPYYYGHVKMSPHIQGSDHYFFANFRKPKRVRTAFSPSQLLTLETAFERNHYVVGTERKHLAQLLELSETQVKVWFQNRRTKHKRQKQDGQSCDQKINGKDCLDSRESSSDEPSTSEDDEEEAHSPSEISSPFEINTGNSLEKSRNSTPVVTETVSPSAVDCETENQTPVVNEIENSTSLVRETPGNLTKAVSSKIWNPVSMLSERSE